MFLHYNCISVENGSDDYDDSGGSTVNSKQSERATKYDTLTVALSRRWNAKYDWWLYFASTEGNSPVNRLIQMFCWCNGRTGRHVVAVAARHCAPVGTDSCVIHSRVSSSRLASGNPTTPQGITNFVQMFTNKYYKSGSKRYWSTILLLKCLQKKRFWIYIETG